MSYIYTVLFSVVYGWIEAVILECGFNPGDWNKLFGKFSVKYHIPMAVLFVIAALGFGKPELIPGMVLIEDASYFAFSTKDKLTSKSWVTGSWGWQQMGRVFIPNVYIGLALIQGLVYALKSTLSL